MNDQAAFLNGGEPGHHVGSIDRVEAGNGFLVVNGWLACIDGSIMKLPMFIFINNSISAIIRQFFDRSDLFDIDKRLKPSAFYQLVSLPNKLNKIERIDIFTADGKLVFGSGSTPIHPFSPRGIIESANAGGVHGWAFAPETWLQGQKATIEIDNIVSFPLELNIERPDVAKAHRSENNQLGFRVAMQDLLAAALRGAVGRAPFEGTTPLLHLKVGSTILDSQPVTLTSSARGKLEAHRGRWVTGWAVTDADPEIPAIVRLSLNGVPFATQRARRPRADLASAGISQSAGAFKFPLSFKPSSAKRFIATAEVVGGSELSGSIEPVLHDVVHPIDWSICAASLQRLQRGVSVIVPVYNAAEETERCLKSLVEQTSQASRIIIIDDASPDPRIKEVLSRFADIKGIDVVRNETNLGYVRTCNHGIELAGSDDVVLLNSDTEVSQRWLQNLRLAAYSRPNVATVTPLSDNAGVFSVPEINVTNSAPAGFSHGDMARLVLQSSRAMFPSVPTGNGFCLYIRRDAIERIGSLDAEAFPRGYGEENDFCLRALRAGLINIVDDRTYVHHVRSASFLGDKSEHYENGQRQLALRYPEYSVLKSSYADDAELIAMRWRVRSAVHTAQKPDASPPKARLLFVISSDSGGTPHTNFDLMQGLDDRYEPWLLRCDSYRIYLSRFLDGEMTQVEHAELRRPIQMASHQSEEYNHFVARILIDYGIELVHIRHFAWHGLDLFGLCKRLSIPIVLSFHDFYTICPTNKLIDSECGACCLIGKQSESYCKAELWAAEGVPPLKPSYIEQWRARIWDAIQQSDAFVTTSQFAYELLCKTYPDLANRNFQVIPHGRSFEAMHALAAPVVPNDVLRVIVPGNISAAKGAMLIDAIAERDGGQNVVFHILGDYGALVQKPGIVLHGRYQRHEFAEKTAKIRPHIGAVLSLWPETYCHTLTELWSCGIPVLGLDVGAVGERLQRHGAGWLMPRESAPLEILAQLIAFGANPDEIRRCSAAALAWQENYGTTYTREMMAAVYDRLYYGVLEKRLVFKEPEDRALWGLIPYRTPMPARLNMPETRHFMVPLRRMPNFREPEFAQITGVVLRPGTPDMAHTAIRDALLHGAGRPVVLDARLLDAQAASDILNDYQGVLSSMILDHEVTRAFSDQPGSYPTAAK